MKSLLAIPKYPTSFLFIIIKQFRKRKFQIFRLYQKIDNKVK